MRPMALTRSLSMISGYILLQFWNSRCGRKITVLFLKDRKNIFSNAELNNPWPVLLLSTGHVIFPL